MMVKSWKLARKFPDTTLDQRYRMKLGFLYTYYMFIKDHTSENAIILFPNPGQIFEGRKDVDQRLTDKYCLTYFLYPRNVVMKGEVDNPLMGKVTHVAIASGHGYEDLGYETSNKPEFTVIPKR